MAAERLKPIFALITADWCSFCKRFVASDLVTLKKRLETLGDVTFYHIDTGKTHPMDFNLYPEDLGRLSRGVPAFTIINTSSWRRRENLEAEVYGMIIDEKGLPQPIPDAKPYTVDNLIEWTKATIRKPNITADLPSTPKTTSITKKGGIELSEIF